MSKSFSDRLHAILPGVIARFGTPFFMYDEDGIRETCKSVERDFDSINRFVGFREYYASKANTNPAVLDIFSELGIGFDDSSVYELQESRASLLRKTGTNQSERIIFSSNNTSRTEFAEANKDGGCIVNLDDISLVPDAPMPLGIFCVRYNPGTRRQLDSAIGKTGEQKYGIMHSQLVEAYQMGMERGATRYGIHTMIVSNELNYKCHVETYSMVLEIVEMLYRKLGIRLEFMNIGGGVAIPYKPGDVDVPLSLMANEIFEIMKAFKEKYGFVPKLFMEMGRYMTGPHGVLVATCITKKDIYLKFRGLDVSCVSSMQRPAIYYPNGGYHHISVYNAEGRPLETVNIVGSACENADQFGRDRLLPRIEIGDVIIVHDAGAHCYAMHSNYNARLAPQELMLCLDGSVRMIRRAEIEDDLRATLRFEENVWKP